MKLEDLRDIGLEPALATRAPPTRLHRKTVDVASLVAAEGAVPRRGAAEGPCWWELCCAESVERLAREELEDPHRLHLPYEPPCDDYLSSRLTVVVFTSPIPSNPSTEMIAAVIESMKLIPGLPDCRLLVVCDGPGEVRWDECRPKKGLLTPQMCARYAEYTARLRIQLGADKVLRLPFRHGFGHAVQESLRHVYTDFVVIVQHDNMFVRPVDLRGVVRLMEAHRETLKCVHFVSPKTAGGDCEHAERRFQYRFGSIVGPTVELVPPMPPGEESGTAAAAAAPMKFIPLPSWLERNHVCFTDHYRECVFGDSARRIRPGEFIEETFGQCMRRTLQQEGPPAHKRFGVFRLLDAPGPVTFHLDGRCFLPTAERIRRGWMVSDLFERLRGVQREQLLLQQGRAS